MPCVVVGINGSQGSGKSTLAAYLKSCLELEHRLNVVVVSLDDFYYSKAERLLLSTTVHPLLINRGVPGTHDIPLARQTLHALSTQKNADIIIPRFDKSNDDRYPPSQWQTITAPVDVIIFEGWCLNAKAQSNAELVPAINRLERKQDASGTWRHYVNEQLKNHYPKLFNYADITAMLKAPSFDCVYRWRVEQEHKLKQKIAGQGGGMSDTEIAVFIQHFQRITEHCLNTLADQLDHVFELDEDRNISF